MMKRRTLITAICLLTALVAFTGLLVWSRQSSIESQQIREASLALRSGDSGQSAQGAQILKELGPRATPLLAEQLTRGESLLQGFRKKVGPYFPRSIRTKVNRSFPPRDPFSDKLGALRALSVLGTNAAFAVPAMEQALQDPHMTLSWTAAAALANVGPDGLPPLLRSLQNTNPTVRQSGCYGLGIMQSNAAPAVSSLITLLGDTNPPVQLSAQSALLSLGELALAPLANAVFSSTESVRTGALQVLRNTRPAPRAVVPVLLKSCTDTNPATRALAVQIIGHLFPWDTNAITALTLLLADPDESVILEAVRALQRAGPLAQNAIPRFTSLLQSTSPALREAAAGAFLRMGSLARPALPELEKLLDDSAEPVRRAASNSIAVIQAARP